MKQVAFACRNAASTPKIAAESSCGSSSIVPMPNRPPPGRCTAITSSNTCLAAPAARSKNVAPPSSMSSFDRPMRAEPLLPPGAAEAILASDADFGGFRIAFTERSLRLKIAAFLINLRTRLTKQPWGDQAQFVKRAAFPGFREIPIMEDYELARTMKRRVILPLTVLTSGRRFLEKGVLRTAFINWRTIVQYHLGADPAELARRY